MVLLRWSTPVRQDESLHWLGQRSVWRRNWTRPDQTTAFEFHSSLDGPVPVWFCIGRRPNSVDPGVDGVRSTLPSGAAQLQGRPLQPRRVVHLFLSSSPQPRRAAPTLLLPQQEKKTNEKSEQNAFFRSFSVRSIAEVCFAISIVDRIACASSSSTCCGARFGTQTRLWCQAKHLGRWTATKAHANRCWCGRKRCVDAKDVARGDEGRAWLDVD